jgi:Rab3 GTPase-activating protein catalytic subunit
MKIPGNVWVEIWSTAKAMSVRRQKRLFDDTKEAEKIFEWLNALSVGQVVELFLPTLFYSAILQILHESHNILIGFEDELEKIIDKLIKISRDKNRIPEYKV